MEILKWHVETQLTLVQQDSDLLFPSKSGGFRAADILNKPFGEISTMMKLGYQLTQIGMRRTFNDLARRAEISGVITRSVSGHLTEEMQRQYSSVRGDEQARGLAKVVDLMTVRAASGAPGGAPASEVVPRAAQ